MASAVVPLRSEAIAGFDALLHELNPDAVRVDPDRLQNLLGWLVSLPAADAEAALERRLGRRTERVFKRLQRRHDREQVQRAAARVVWPERDGGRR